MARLCIGLDGLTTARDETLRTLGVIADVTHFDIKINLDYILDRGLRTVEDEFRRYGRDLFFDLKMWNGARTMSDTFKLLIDLNISYVTVHAVADDQLAKAMGVVKGSNLKVLATTVLTHYTEAYCQKHFRRTRARTVRHLAEVARDAGTQGIVLPGQYLDLVRDIDLLKVVPGLRMDGGVSDGRHDVEITPEDARKHGAHIGVVSSPIMKSNDPVAAARAFQRALAG